VLNLLLSGGLVVTLVTLRSQKAKAEEEAKGLALDNDKKVSEMVNEYFVEPLKKDITSLRRQVSRLTRAIEKIPSCPHSADCPVKEELNETKNDDL
jgi:chaperonin GroEL (HSP60 family)